LFSRTCPSCKSFNARRSTVRTSEVTLRHVFLSPYRCRDCRTRFWVLSKNSYYLVAAVGAMVLLGALAWSARIFYEMPRVDDKPIQKDPRLPDLLKLAANNDPVAEYELARMYGNGYGVPKNLQEEHKWLERAARHGNIQAQYEFGVALRDGHGTVQDYEGARKWMQLASEAGNGHAQLALGLMYRTGLGIPVDNIKAYVWLNIAAAQGVPGATAARDVVLPRLTSVELQEAQAEARRLGALYVPKAAAPSQ
jgi:TPR repeat protein